MPVYHVVLFKLKSNTSPDTIEELKQAVKAMVGQIPGLQSVELGPPHPSTVHRSQGYDMGLVAVLDKPETIQVYAQHPSHVEVNKIREPLSEETLAYDLEF